MCKTKPLAVSVGLDDGLYMDNNALKKLKEDIEQDIRNYWSNNDYETGSIEITIESHRCSDIEKESGYGIENFISFHECPDV